MSKVWINGVQLSDCVENIHEKKRNCLLHAISSFPYDVFKSGLLLMHQNEYLLSKGFNIYQGYKKICSE